MAWQSEAGRPGDYLQWHVLGVIDAVAVATRKPF